MRLGGLEIPDHERVEIALTRVYGIGRSNVKKLIELVKLDPNKRAKDLTKDETGKIIAALEKFMVEGDLRREVRDNIERLKSIRSYRGIRHIVSLPVRGQRTKSNARTKRGKKKTVGAMTKEMWAKIEAQQKEAAGKN